MFGRDDRGTATQWQREVGGLWHTKNIARVSIDRLDEVYGAVFGLIELSVNEIPSSRQE